MYKTSVWEFNWLGLSSHNKVVLACRSQIRGVIYDFGCGLRPYEKDLLDVADKYIGVDWSLTPHELHADIVADLNGILPIPDCAADSIVSFQVMEHLCEPGTMLSEAFRILRPNSNMLITVPFQWWIHEAPYDYYRYTRYGLEYLFSRAGFQNIQIREIGGFWSMWILKINYQSMKIVRGPPILRKLTKLAMGPFWLLNNCLALSLDKVWNAPQEALGYIVIARKL